MPTAKVLISIDQRLLAEVDELVRRRVFSSRSQAVQAAVQEKIQGVRRLRLAEECAKLDPKAEQAATEEGTTEWPEY